MSTFKLVIKGELLPGQAPDEVKARITKLFKLQDKPGHVEALFSKQPVTVKKGLSEEQAQAYRGAIKKAGMNCELVSENDALAAEPPRQAPAAGAAETQPAPVHVEHAATQARQAPPVAQDTAETSAVPPAEAPMPSTPPAVEPAAQAPAAEPVEDYNPYQQPQADLYVADEHGELSLVEPKKLSLGAGWSWFSEGFDYFKMQPLTWLGAVVVFFVLLIVFSMIPLLNLLVNLFMAVITAGFMVMCFKLYQGEATGIGDMFAGFRNRFGGLLAVGAVYCGVGIAIMLLGFVMMFGAVGGLSVLVGASQAESGVPPVLGMGVMLGFLVMVGLSVPLMMAFWFAPALVMLHDVPALRAMGMSFKGCIHNILPFLIYGLVGFVLAIIATIPIGLGWLVLFPVMWGSMFAGYRQIFTDIADA